jgi:pantetheine-phosphate adenylyltransferase
MKRIAVFPGSFDPITIGHTDLVKRALPLFDQVIIALGENGQKIPMFDLEERLARIKSAFVGEPKIEVMSYQGLTVEFCKQQQATHILRGLRNPADFEFEKNIAQVNRVLSAEVETVFLMCNPLHTAISSSIVRDIIKNGGDVSMFIP